MGSDARDGPANPGVSESPLRAWGFWTKLKLQILAEYLGAFVLASKTPVERIYLDAFAGQAIGVDRLTGEEFAGSVSIALDAGGDEGFTRFRFFEKDEDRARELDQNLHERYPGQEIKVYTGDCNAQIPKALAELKSLNWAPTFAFLDPDGMELEWGTLLALSDHKRGYRSGSSDKPEYKIELWMLFSSGGLVRTLALDESKFSDTDESRATRLFGSEGWRPIYELRKAGKLTASEAREEYVNLMRWRIENELGYRYTHAFEIKNTSGVPIYHMIFATDNDAGTQIMASIYDKAAQLQPEMRQEARDRARGQLALDLGSIDSASGYRYEPPWEPRSSSPDG